MTTALGRLLSAWCCAALLAGTAGAQTPFHPDGGGKCGCHTMHMSEDGLPITAGPKLIRGATATDLCLSCHATQNGSVLTAAPTMPPPEIGGGNFTYLLEDDLNDTPGGGPIIRGNHAGHNVVSPGWGILEDPDHPTAPGGSYPSSQLGCISCHDPHGGGNYRMLRGSGPIPGGFNFTYDAPQAVGIALNDQEGLTSHTAYQGGWTRWCANCHGMFHDQGSPQFIHPVDKSFGGDQRDSYNLYRGEADPTGGDPATAYIPEVPFEDPSAATSSRSGPSGSARVGCISCHRAHATSAPEATRWDKTVLYLHQDGVASGSYPIPNPYPGPAQRALCNKCHMQKTRSHGQTQPCLECHGQGSL